MDKIQELNAAPKPKTNMFNASSRTHVDKPVASAENIATKESIRNKLSVYFSACRTISLQFADGGALLNVMISDGRTCGLMIVSDFVAQMRMIDKKIKKSVIPVSDGAPSVSSD